MEQLSEEEIEHLDLDSLIQRMDAIIDASHFGQDASIMRFSVSLIMTTAKVKSLNKKIQRDIAYKVFGLFIQMIYTNSRQRDSRPTKFGGDVNINSKLIEAEKKQQLIISSRIIGEYFVTILYLIGTGESLNINKSIFKPIKKWLKIPHNAFVYFALTISRIKTYSREYREGEIHARTKFSKKILTLSPYEIDVRLLSLLNRMSNQWHYVLRICDNKDPGGYSWGHYDEGDEKWYETVAEGNQELIDKEIDRMFSDSIST